MASATRGLKPIVLYDIPGNAPECKAWAPNPWKVRYALNYKGLPLQTEWVELPDIGVIYQRFGLSAIHHRADGSPLYTLPIIHDPNTSQTIVDSMAIARYLDKNYPDTPALFPKGSHAFHAAFIEASKPVFVSLYTLVCYSAWTRLNKRSQEQYRITREAQFGMKLENIRTDVDWERAERVFGAVDKWFRANLVEGEGRDELIIGDGICFADMILASGLIWAKTALGHESKEWDRIMSWNEGRWKRFMERFARHEFVDS